MNIHWEKIKLRCVGSVRWVEKLGVRSEALQLPLAPREHGAQSDHDRVEGEPGFRLQTLHSKGLAGQQCLALFISLPGCQPCVCSGD